MLRTDRSQDGMGCDLCLRPAAHGCASAAEAMDGRERPP